MRTLVFLSIMMSVFPLYAQFDKGILTGSLESNNIYYVNDSKLESLPGVTANPDDHFGSNTYLKLDYLNGNLSAGIQLEGFLPPLQGYDYAAYSNGNKVMLGSKYVSWQDDKFSFRVGDIFEQYGSGLVFRSYEDRTLGFNNSIEGVKAGYKYSSIIEVSGLFGRPRLCLDYAESSVRGVDFRLGLADIFNWNSGIIDVEGSYVNRYESVKDDDDFVNRINTNSLDMYSARLFFNWKGFDANLEYVMKSNDIPTSDTQKMIGGKAVLAELQYSYKSFSVLGTFRKLTQMSTMLSLKGSQIGTSNCLNYLPSLTRQYTYSLANLNPYQVQGVGESAVQIDAFYSIRNRNDRYKYWNFHANFSTAYSDVKVTRKSRLLWRDVNADVEHQWNKNNKTSFLVSIQEWNPSHGVNDRTYVSNIFVLDNLYKISRKMALRAELQYLYSVDYEKDWIAASVEFSVSPNWSFSVGDMYNHGSTKVHYYNANVSFTQKSTRIQLGYGRNRAGYVCSGGMCRWSPAFTGANLVVTSTF